jgi:acetamidase/formamidase
LLTSPAWSHLDHRECQWERDSSPDRVIHDLAPDRSTLHGHFSRDLAPVLEIDPGDSIRTRTLSGSWEGADFPRHPELDGGHALIGPVCVRGAEPGDALAVDIVRLQPARYGSTRVGGWSTMVNDRVGLKESRRLVEWEIDSEAGVARALDFEVELHPFLGVIGLAPSQPGIHSTVPPRSTGGNIDCRELVAGSRLVLPVAVPGGLLSFGDGHAAQGDGEVAGTAIECAMDYVELRVELLERTSLRNPEAYTPAGYVTFGFSTDLAEATLVAVEAMIDHLEVELGVDRSEAAALATVAVDIRVTQIVNETLGVHALLPANRMRRIPRTIEGA